MKILFFIVLILSSISTVAYASSCDDSHWIEEVARDGQIIILEDGSVWESLDPITSSLWLPPAEIIICNDALMINTDDKETVDVQRIK
jgi:hypothetical protein